MLKTMRQPILALSILTFALASSHALPCFSEESSGTVAYSAQDYAFAGPDSMSAGWTTVDLTNRGDDLHQLQFIKLPPGKTSADFVAAIAANPTRMPSWVDRRGGPNSIVPGAHATAIVHLDPGNYVVICGIPDRRGIPHVALGMMRAVTVTATASGVTQPPTPDNTINLVDFGFEFSPAIRSGARTIRVVNQGAQAHELVLVQLTSGATVRDFVTAFRPGVPTLPAGNPVGGVVGLDPGGVAFFRADLSPGNYGLICFLPDFIRGSPHFALGMLLDLTVK